MILDILVFALGFLIAGLLALAALPTIWRRALRLSGERLSRLVPLSPEEIAAERDHLRAAHAVAIRRTEQTLERAESDRAALRIEAARREGRIHALDAEAVAAQVRIAGLDTEIARLRQAVNLLQAESGAEAIALHGLATLAENRLFAIAALQGERTALQAERDALAQQVDRDRGSLAGLETRLIGADTHNEDLRRELEQARQDVTAAAERIAAARADRPPVPAPQVHRAEAQAPAQEVESLTIESLTAELAFMTEQAASAERRAAEAAKAYEALRAVRMTANGSEALLSAPDDHARLRAAIAALADDVLSVDRNRLRETADRRS